MPTGAETGGFALQFQEFMYYAGSIVQLLYYVLIPVISTLAFLQLRRWVNAQVGTAPKAEAAEGTVKVDEFVE